MSWKICVPLLLALVLAGLTGYLLQKPSAPVLERETAVEPSLTLTFFGFKTGKWKVEGLEPMLSGYQRERPDVALIYESLSNNQGYDDTLTQRLDTGHGDDLFMVNAPRQAALENADHLADLSDLRTLATFTDAALGQMREADGRVLFVPLATAVHGLYVNNALLRERNLAVPRTLDEFLAACESFRREGVTPVLLNNRPSLTALVLVRALGDAYAAGSQTALFERVNRGEATLREEMGRGFALLALLRDRGYIDAAATLETETSVDDVRRFAEGTIPFMFNGTWQSVVVAALNPDLDYAIHPLPLPDSGPGLMFDIGTRVAVNARGPHRDEAKKLLEYITQPDVLWHYADSQVSINPQRDGKPPSDPAQAPLADDLRHPGVLVADRALNADLWSLVLPQARAILRGLSAIEATERFASELRAALALPPTS